MLTQNLQDNQYNLFNYWRKKETFPSTHNLSEKKLENLSRNFPSKTALYYQNIKVLHKQ
jgi:hypothetical protein